MNQKSIIAILGVVIVILIGTTVYFATINKASQSVVPVPKVVQQPVPTPAPAVQQPTQQTAQATTSPLLYSNKDFGFQLKLPANLSGYKVTVSDSIGGKTKYINFYLPTTDKNWSENFLGDDHTGYARIFSILLTPLSDWTKEVNDCKKNERTFCPSDKTVLAKINNYAFDYYDATSQAQDLIGITVTEEYLKANLKPIN